MQHLVIQNHGTWFYTMAMVQHTHYFLNFNKLNCFTHYL